MTTTTNKRSVRGLLLKMAAEAMSAAAEVRELADRDGTRLSGDYARICETAAHEVAAHANLCAHGDVDQHRASAERSLALALDCWMSAKQAGGVQ